MTKNYQKEVSELAEKIDFTKTDYSIELETSMGNMKLRLFPEKAPNHCKNIISLSKLGFYDGLTFHRIIPNFVIQGGCPEGSGIGGPGYHVDAEFNSEPHELGVLSMARAQDPNSAGSQFFICLGKVPHLDNQYTVFGTVEKENLDIVEKIGASETGQQDRPLEPITITKATVTENPA